MATSAIDPADDFNDAAFGDAGDERPALPKAAVARRSAAPHATRAPRTRRDTVSATPIPARPAGPSRLSTRLAVWLRESRWLLHLAIGLFLALILATYNKTDPGWSHAVASTGVKNAGGRFGAWLADLLLYLFGLSVWWWVLLFAYFLYAGYRRLAHNTAFSAWAGNWLGRSKADDATLLDRRSLASLLPGFALTLVASSALEALRLHSLKAALPYAPGGVLGEVVSRPLAEFTGFTGGTLILLVVGLIGFSLFTGISWLDVAERIGAGIDWLIERTRRKAEERVDRKIGEEAIERREQVVEVERRELFTEHEPIKIEPVFIPVQSPRVEQEQIREKQAPLFNYSELPPDSPLPALSLLDPAPELVEVISPETVEFNSRLIEKKLKDFNVTVLVKAAYPGPVITRYEIEPATGVKGSQIVGLAKDLARALSLVSVRVVETIPGKSLMGLELPNPKRQIVRLSEILGSQVYNDSASMLTLALGKDIAGKPVVADLAKMPHLLVAGTTGAGKSVAINAMILSLLYKAEADRVRLILIDPKMLEMSMYADIPHLLAPVVTDMKQATNALNWCVNEMERRYKLMSSQGVRNLAGFNAKVAEAKKAGKPLTNPFTLTPESPEPLEHMPMIVVVIDELADLMMVIGKKIEELIARLAQKARAAGVHLLLATQRPSVDVITGLIKANIPTRIAFQVSSKIDSRTILDQMGAEALLGQGDMLFLPPGTGLPQRVHGAFVDDHEVHRVVEQLKAMGPPNYVEGLLEGGTEEEGEGAAGDGERSADGEKDPLYDQAVDVVLKNKRASISLVQRHLRIGYNRSARLLEAMEKSGLISAMNGQGNRDILAPRRDQD